MQTVTSFHASSLPQEELGRLLADYLALDRARIVRRLMVARFGVLAAGAALLETVVHGFSVFARSFTVALCLVPPIWAWIVELVRERQLSRHPTLDARAAQHKKVVKSS
jgi:hypothetical protein